MSARTAANVVLGLGFGMWVLGFPASAQDAPSADKVRAALRVADFDTARREAEALAGASGGDAEALTLLGEALWGNGLFDEADAAVARALALDPHVLVLDEPFEGLSPAIIPTVSRGLAEITQRGHAILLAESNIHHVPEFTTRLYVIERGEIIFAGPPDAVRGDAAVMRIIGGAA
jgi:ABC-type sugar transport system ATPase subunit